MAFGLRGGDAGCDVRATVSEQVIRFLFIWARMYMLLFLFCLWYLYIHARLVKSLWRRMVKTCTI